MTATPQPISDWQIAPEALRAQPGVVDVWRIWLGRYSGKVEDWCEMLDSHEQAQARRYRFGHLRENFVLRRAAVRQILGVYVDQAPASLVLRPGQNGRPELRHRWGLPAEMLDFNLSHSGDLALLAVAQGVRVGVDVEQVDRERPPWEIIGALAEGERAALGDLPEPERCEALYRVWVRKEAYLKVCGKGLSVSLDAFEVATAEQTDCVLLRDGTGQLDAAWSACNLSLGHDFCGCVVAAGKDVRVRCFESMF